MEWWLKNWNTCTQKKHSQWISQTSQWIVFALNNVTWKYTLGFTPFLPANLYLSIILPTYLPHETWATGYVTFTQGRSSAKRLWRAGKDGLANSICIKSNGAVCCEEEQQTMMNISRRSWREQNNNSGFARRLRSMMTIEQHADEK
jgi:hypothetical protein